MQSKRLGVIRWRFSSARCAGGGLEFDQGSTVATCIHCGTKQTLPRLDDDRRANLYDRANHFRRNSDFDKAEGIYERILAEDPSDAEAYWSLVLCRYGIEYVPDPATGKQVPTVNRAQYTSVFDDENYKLALQYADFSQRAVYEDEAAAINEIQKGILAISQQEEPFDVFICYKETDANGRRTPDSVLANDLYHQLTQEGFKVFFSRITLEDKLGTEYEPYIFAALNSAKVMVVLGTKPEYFNAVWVKNEWSRYLALVKESNGKKVLIPAYRDMDPYDLPEEFSHLQAQDMSKLGFMQDLIRGIKKLTTSNESTPTVVQPAVVAATAYNANTVALLDRAQMALEDGEWDRADDFCEQVLNVDARNATAYLYKLMAEIHLNNQEDLMRLSGNMAGSTNYQKAIRFGDDGLRAFLEKANRNAIECREREEQEARRKEAYDSAASAAENAVSKQDFEAAARAFENLGDYRDAASRAEAIRTEWARIEAVADDIVRSYTSASQAQKTKTKLEQLQERKQQLEAENIKTQNLLRQRSAFQQKASSFEQQLAQLRSKRDSLGMFAFTEKRETDAAIAAAEKGLAETRSVLMQIQSLRTLSAIDADLSECDREIVAEQEAERKRAAAGVGSVRHTEADLKDYRVLALVKNAYSGGAYPEGIRMRLTLMGLLEGGIVLGRWGGEPMRWRIIARANDRVLALTEKAIDCRRFDASSNKWETSELKRWLEGDFECGAFSDEEKRMMATHPFCLSVDEAYHGFKDDADRVCYPTAHAKKQGAYTNDKGACRWWLRSPGEVSVNAAYVSLGGFVRASGYDVDYDYDAVRPALWLKL